jgi:hypothetical protein
MDFKDSGTRSEFATGAVRDGAEGKGRFDLIPFEALQAVAQVFEAGGKKYADRNWELGMPTNKFADSAMRHLHKHVAGHLDEPHLAMAAWNCLCLLQTEYWIREGRLPRELSTLPSDCRNWDRMRERDAERTLPAE